ncbi:MAG: urate hydroxylase PuuD [Pseudomonadota bacterium]|nr:urate hydroxylase PuuD [Pseudomonadota bacterium]MEC7735269.1 urate hydroxylase PuuD [Pseudomonadota bacterium]MEC9392265.1 urate hydroxylase PuuD [Pseudomonadota bacterium]MEC9459491.1 urate hydroxylase PuuD [Pseudomonadota bacterium]
MSSILTSLRNTVIVGFIIALILLFVSFILTSGSIEIGEGFKYNPFWAFVFRWLHVLSGVMWIGLLWYFNFVQIPNMGNIPDEQKPAISKVIAPAALWWFRYGAMATIITGLILAYINGYIHEAMTLTLMEEEIIPNYLFIGIGMWLGIIMWFNVWFVIWPNQKKALGIVDADPDVKAASARTAMLFSRTNTLLSIPMLFCMVIAQNIY